MSESKPGFDFIKDRMGIDFQSTSFKDCVFQYGTMAAFLTFSIVMIYYAANDPNALTTKTYAYAISIILPIVIGIFLVFPASDTKNVYSIMGFITIAILGIVLAYYYVSLDPTSMMIATYVMTALIFLIIMVGLGIIFKMFYGKFSEISDSNSGIFLQLLFYIPCLISDFFEYLAGQFKITPNPIFILFILEIILVLIYLYAPSLIQLILKSSTNNVELLKTPIFLDVPYYTSANKYPFTMSKVNQNTLPEDITFRQNYGISMWVYTNPQPVTNVAYAEETPIFDYSGKPTLVYCNQCADEANADNVFRDTYIVYFNNNDSSAQHKITVPNQKWNNFVFNYNNNIVDVFVNGILERSYELSGNQLPIHSTLDQITLGATNGLSGAICNVTYSPVPFTKSQIANTYNILMYQNPPVNYA